jgi:hypothetical protein
LTVTVTVPVEEIEPEVAVTVKTYAPAVVPGIVVV